MFRLLASGWSAFAFVLWAVTVPPGGSGMKDPGRGFFVAFWLLGVGL